jgi:hypothetical protein
MNQWSLREGSEVPHGILSGDYTSVLPTWFSNGVLVGASLCAEFRNQGRAETKKEQDPKD